MSATVSNISSGVPSMPAAGAAQFLGQSAGFASALAAAQGVSNPAQRLASASGRTVAANTSPAATGNVATPEKVTANGNVTASIPASVPAKKLSNQAPAGAANLVAPVGTIVPAALVPVLSPFFIASVVPSAANVGDQNPQASSGPATLEISSLANWHTPQFQSAVTVPGFTATVGQASTGHAAIGAAENATAVPAGNAATLLNAPQANVAPTDGSSAIGDQSTPGVSLPGDAPNAQPNLTSISEFASDAVMPMTSGVTQIDPASSEAAAAPILLASAAPAGVNSAGENPRGQWASANFPGGATNPAASTPQSAATQWNLPAQPGITSAISAVPLPAAQLLIPASPAANGKLPLPFSAARVSAAITTFAAHAAPSGTSTASGASSSLPSQSSSLSPAAGSVSNSAVLGQQTPFAVFFSNPGPGTEAAAASVPKMILPPSGAAQSANPVTVGAAAGAKNNAAPGTALQPTAANSKSAASGAEATASVQQNLAVTAASAQLNPAQTMGAQAQAPAAASASALSLAQVASSGNALPTGNALPMASSSAVPVAAQPAEMPAMPAAGPVQMAQLVSQAGQSEMRIGMNTSAFGSVEVRTVMRANDVGLVIGSEKGDLRTALANEIPAITNSLQQQNLRLNSVNYMQGFAFSNNFSGGGGSQQRSYAPNPAPSSLTSDSEANAPAESAPMAAFVSGTSSLSILA